VFLAILALPAKSCDKQVSANLNCMLLMLMVTFPCCSSVKMPFPESGCMIAGDYLLIECVGIAAVQMRSVQSNSIYWTWLVAIGWAACVAPAQVGSRASMQ